jgi:hypothetical protein
MKRTLNRYCIAGLLVAMTCGLTFAAEDLNKLYASGFGDKDAAALFAGQPTQKWVRCHV